MTSLSKSLCPVVCRDLVPSRVVSRSAFIIPQSLTPALGTQTLELSQPEQRLWRGWSYSWLRLEDERVTDRGWLWREDHWLFYSLRRGPCPPTSTQLTGSRAPEQRSQFESRRSLPVYLWSPHSAQPCTSPRQTGLGSTVAHWDPGLETPTELGTWRVDRQRVGDNGSPLLHSYAMCYDPLYTLGVLPATKMTSRPHKISFLLLLLGQNFHISHISLLTYVCYLFGIPRA